MRSLRVNRRTFWFAKYLGEQPVLDDNGNPTVEVGVKYGEPVKARANVSAANGDYVDMAHGLKKDYERTIYTHRLDYGITENSRVWFGKNPDDGPANYIVTRVVDGLHGFFYEIRQVDTTWTS